MITFVAMRETFGKREKLKSKKLIQQLFAEGKSMSVFPIKLVYLETDHESTSKILAGVSVSKRHFKRAVARNRIKRLLRESYRRNKHLLYASGDTKKYIFMFIYQADQELDYVLIEKKMKAFERDFQE